MSHSLDIIRHILDENLIDAKKATEGYLNDILSGAIKEQYKEVAPTLVAEEDKPAAMMNAQSVQAPSGGGGGDSTVTAPEGGFTSNDDTLAWLRNYMNLQTGQLLPGITAADVFAAAEAQGYMADGQSIAYLTANMGDPGQGPTTPDPDLDPGRITDGRRNVRANFGTN